MLEGDIKGCFDHISHEWLIENIPMDKSVLKQFLKAGFVFRDELFQTEEGTPQGGLCGAPHNPPCGVPLYVLWYCQFSKYPAFRNL